MTSSSDQKEPVVERSPGEEPDDPTGRALRLRIRQQELLAELGVLALQGTSFIEMLNHTARITAEGLPSLAIYQFETHLTDSREIFLLSGTRWPRMAFRGQTKRTLL